MEVNAAGYQDIRDRIEANWQYIELLNAAGTAVVRLPVSDPRVTWVHTPGAQTLQLQVVVQGSDADIPVPVTLRSSALYKAASGGSPMHGPRAFTEGDFTFSADADRCTITHSLSVPQI